MNYFHELSISNKVSFKQIATIVSDYVNIPYEKIGTGDVYLDRLETTDELQIGIDIYYYPRDYKTFIKVDHLNFGLEDSQIIGLACELAIGLESNVALGDMTANRELAYVIISPDKKYQKAYDISKDEETNEFATYAEKADISKYLSMLDNDKKSY